MKQLKALPAFALVIFAMLTVPMAAITASTARSNICDAEELWEGECVLEEDWIAGWYLHRDNDPGDGSAVETAYANFAHVIVHKPYSMCIDWRTANCDGTIPPESPEPGDESRRSPKLADRGEECVVLVRNPRPIPNVEPCTITI